MQTRLHAWPAAAAAITLLSCAPAVDAAAIVYTASLDGPGESPPNASPGTGSVTVTYDDAAFTLRVQATFAGLLAPTTAAHIHCCTTTPMLGTAGVASMTPTFAGFPSGVTSGTYDASFDLSNLSDGSFFNPSFLTANGGSVATARATLLAGMDAGRAYFNIHTPEFPGGEIRGFLQRQELPLPGTAALLAIGVAVLAGKRRVAGRTGADG